MLDPLAFEPLPLADARFPGSGVLEDRCPICGAAALPRTSWTDGAEMQCQRCGTYRMTGSALSTAPNLDDRTTILLSGYTRDHLLSGVIAEISSNIIREAPDWRMPDLLARADRMLRWIALQLDHEPNDDDLFQPSSPALIGASYSRDQTHSKRVASVLHELGYAVPPQAPRPSPSGLASFASSDWRLTAKGRLRVEALERSSDASTTGFAAMWFAQEVLPAWEGGIRPGIADAGFDPVRIDGIEHVNRIDDEIMLRIRAARFVVADFTGHRGGVYFEAGYALGLGLPVLWTCRRDAMADLHFDIRQYNCIDWATPDELHRRLAARIIATVGHGPRSAAARE